MIDAPESITPFPLRRRFLLYVIPGLAVVILALLTVVSQALSTMAERLYERETVVKHRQILTAVAEAGGPGWISSAGAEGDKAAGIRKVLASEAQEMGFTCIALRSATDRLLMATSSGGCEPDRAELLETVRVPGDSGFKEGGSDGPQWVVASLVQPAITRSPVIVITRQDARRMETLIGATTRVWIAALLAAFAAILVGAVWLVGQAQHQINHRTGALIEARRSLARFVSKHGQAQANRGEGAARRLMATVLFLDIRDFSGFADAASPEDAAALVEAVAKIAFEEILSEGGDIDRLLGDGIIAWFEGEDRRDRAWRAVAAILCRTERSGLPRGVGAGLHDGELLEATIGAGERLDHTILGRTVNIASRLCGAARSGEVVASQAMGLPPDRGSAQGYEDASLRLKGIAEAMQCKRVSFRERRLQSDVL